MIICTDCRKQNRAGAPYCIFCGASLANEKIQESQLRSTIKTSESASEKQPPASRKQGSAHPPLQPLHPAPIAELVAEAPEREMHSSEAGESLPPEIQPGIKNTPRRLRGWHIAPIFMVLMLLSGAVWLFQWQPGPESLSGFEKAEQLYQSAQYADAIIAYWKFIDQQPRDPRVETAAAHIAAARSSIAASPEQQYRLQSRFDQLMQQANLAYQAGRYIEPANDCTYHYLWQATKLLPTANEAYALQEKMYAALYRQAREALAQQQYETALRHYQALREMFPNDMQIYEAIEQTKRKAMN